MDKATGDFLGFVDNDVELTGNVSRKIINVFSDIKVGIIGKTGILFSPKLHPFTVNDIEVDAVPGFF